MAVTEMVQERIHFGEA